MRRCALLRLLLRRQDHIHLQILLRDADLLLITIPVFAVVKSFLFDPVFFYETQLSDHIAFFVLEFLVGMLHSWR